MSTSMPELSPRARDLAKLLVLAAFLIGGGASAAGAAIRLVEVGGADAGDCLAPSPCLTITYALTQAAASGDTISIGPGTFVDNVIVDKSVVLAGAGQGSTTIVPEVTDLTCSGGSLCTATNNVVLVQADGVEIHHLTIDGDNPALDTGFDVGGANVDARNGIITDHRLGTAFTGLKVHDVTVRNVFLRGIYSSTNGGTFTFERNTIQNVQADPGSICMFAFTGSGTMQDNIASGCNDAFASNWSTGIEFLGNTVTDSGSAVHTDNAVGPTADLIDDNHASAMKPDSYGFWVFASRSVTAPTVSNNTASGVTVGLGAFGGDETVDAGDQDAVKFHDNIVDCASRTGSVGAWVSTTLFQFGSADTHASLLRNRISNCWTGIDVQAEWTVASYTAVATGTGNTVTGSALAGVFVGAGPVHGTHDVELHHNRIAGNANGLQNTSTQAVDAALNWWGCNAGPGGAGALGPCDNVLGVATFAPWLVLAAPVVTPPVFAVGGSAGVTTDLAHDSTSAAAAPGVPDDTPVGLTTTLPGATLTPPTDLTLAGEASSLLTSTTGGSGVVCAQVDNEKLCTPPVKAGGYNTVTPCRVLDTRNVGPALTSGVLRMVTVAGVCGVPATARTVAINVTVTEPTGLGHLTVYPADLALPGTSTLNFGASQTRACNAVIPLATDSSGQLAATAVVAGSGTVHLIVDVLGYFD